jgi:hypothetical protein
MAPDMSSTTLPTPDVGAIMAELAREKPHAMTMNLVVWNADAENRPWVLERAIAIGEKHPSRTIILDASPLTTGAIVTTAEGGTTAESARIELGVAKMTTAEIADLVRSLRVQDLPTILWWSSAAIGAETPFAGVVALADSVVVDSSSGDVDSTSIVELTHFLSTHQGCVVRDLAWMRINAWQDMVAHFFDDPHLREELFSIRRLRIVSGSDAEALYLGGWLGSRLGWTAKGYDEFVDRNGKPVAFEHQRAGRPRRVRSVAVFTDDNSYQGERLESDDLIVRVWADGKYPSEERLFPLQWVDGASLVERAILEGQTDEIFETALRMVGMLTG